MNRYFRAIASVPFSIKGLILTGIVGFVVGGFIIVVGARPIGLSIVIFSFVLLVAGIIRWNIYAWQNHLKDKFQSKP